MTSGKLVIRSVPSVTVRQPRTRLGLGQHRKNAEYFNFLPLILTNFPIFASNFPQDDKQIWLTGERDSLRWSHWSSGSADVNGVLYLTTTMASSKTTSSARDGWTAWWARGRRWAGKIPRAGKCRRISSTRCRLCSTWFCRGDLRPGEKFRIIVTRSKIRRENSKTERPIIGYWILP